MRLDLGEEASTAGIERDRIVLAVEQRGPDELFERLDPPGQRWRREGERVRSGFDRALPSDCNERLYRP